MQLTIFDRFALLSILPDTGSLLQMSTMDSFKKSLFLSEEEKLKIGAKDIEGNKLEFPKGFNLKNEDYAITIDVTSAEKIMLKEIVNTLDEQKKVNLDTLDVCLRIKDL